MTGTWYPSSRWAMFQQARAAPRLPRVVRGCPQIGTQNDLWILRDHAQQGEAGGVHGVVDGGAQSAQGA